MEQREQLKDSVKQRLIEFMAEQITKEEGFTTLKSELIEELFVQKEIKTQILNDSTPGSLSDKFGFVATRAENSLEKIKQKQAEYYKKIIDVKLGNGMNENVQKLIKELRDEDSTRYSDILEQLNGNDITEYKEFILDPRLKGDLPKEKHEELRASSINVLKVILENPFSKTLDVSVQSYTNEANYYKAYNVYEKDKDFRFECSFVYNDITKQKYINKFQVDSKGFLLFGEELGIPFAIEAMSLVDKSEADREKAISSIEKTKEKQVVKKRQVKIKK